MTEPLTPKAKHQALEQRVATLEQADGTGGGLSFFPPLLAVTPARPLLNELPSGTAETVNSGMIALVLQSTPTTTPTVIAGIGARLHVPDGANVTVAYRDAEGYELYEPCRATNEGTNADPHCLIEFPPLLFGRDAETVTVFFDPPVVGVHAGQARPDTPVRAFLRDGIGNQVSVTTAVTLLPAPSPLVDGPVGHHFLPVRPVAAPGPSGQIRDGYTEVVYPADPFEPPVLRHRFAGQWWVLPFVLEQSGGGSFET